MGNFHNFMDAGFFLSPAITKAFAANYIINFIKYRKLFFIITVFTSACVCETMKITISEKINLTNVPSGSGIIKVNDSYYAIGDDTPFLFRMNNSFGVEERIPLQNIDNFTGERIIKSEKADFEALEMISEKEFVIFGSGSKSPQRDVFIQVLMQDPIKIETYASTGFYNSLKSLKIFSDSELNIEAVAFRNGHIFLFNRKKNIVLNFAYEELLSYLKGTASFPQPEITQYNLPKINGIEAGFSGATTLKNQAKIIFTASVENTDNAYDDGEILGSFIGTIDLADNNVSPEIQYCQIPETKAHLKVESVTIDKEISLSKTKVVLITDNDKGNSVILKAVLSW